MSSPTWPARPSDPAASSAQPTSLEATAPDPAAGAPRTPTSDGAPGPNAATTAAIAAAKAASTGQLLMRCGRLMNTRALAEVRRATGFDIRPAHTNLFPHLDLSGTRLTTLARRAGISKQAVGQLVDDLERMGALERVADPADKRAKLIRFAAQPDGTHGILAGLAVLAEVEQTLSAAIGPQQWAALHDALSALLPILEEHDG